MWLCAFLNHFMDFSTSTPRYHNQPQGMISSKMMHIICNSQRLECHLKKRINCGICSRIFQPKKKKTRRNRDSLGLEGQSQSLTVLNRKPWNAVTCQGAAPWGARLAPSPVTSDPARRAGQAWAPSHPVSPPFPHPSAHHSFQWH